MTKNELIEMIAEQLQNYAEGRRELARLSETLANFKDVSDDDVITSMAYPQHNDSRRVTTSGISDPTARVALIFRESGSRINASVREELTDGIIQLRTGLDCLLQCITALPERQRIILMQLYADEYSWLEVAERENLAVNTIGYHRKRGIEGIAMMPPYYRRLYSP